MSEETRGSRMCSEKYRGHCSSTDDKSDAQSVSRECEEEKVKEKLQNKMSDVIYA